MKTLPMTEATLTSAVLDAMQRNGWRAFHIHDSRRAHYRATSAGFPDVIALRPIAAVATEDEQPGRARSRLLVVELKGHDSRGRLGKLSPSQEGWLADWRVYADGVRVEAPWDSDVEVYVWTPADLRSGDVDRVLA